MIGGHELKKNYTQLYIHTHNYTQFKKHFLISNFTKLYQNVNFRARVVTIYCLT